MKIVYHCYGGAHASPVAAAIHLGILAKDRLPSFRDFKRVPYFDTQTKKDHGRLIKIAPDHWGNEIYILARRNATDTVINLIKEFFKLTEGNPEEYFFVDCVQLYNLFMVAGGFSSRAMGWVGMGRPVVTFGTILSFPILVGIVNRTLRKVETDQMG